jgi:hypothetical protein
LIHLLCLEMYNLNLSKKTYGQLSNNMIQI